VLLVTGVLAGIYPAWLAARAPIALTLRTEAT
jgi:ABC-type lipoprotein release transport system permease subunit